MNELDRRYDIIEKEFKDYRIYYVKKPTNFALNGEDGYTEQEVIIHIGRIFNIVIHESSDFFENCPIEVFNCIIKHKCGILDEAHNFILGTVAKDKQFMEQCLCNKQYGIEENYISIEGYKYPLLNISSGFVRYNDDR